MKQLFIGVDLGGTNLRCAVIDDKNEIISRFERPTEAFNGHEAVIGKIVDGVENVIQQAGCKASDIAAVGIGVPGPINQKEGIVYSTPNMPGWNNVPLAEIVKARTGLTTCIENDANCAGWGEFVAGAGAQYRHMLMVTLGTGIGGAIIMDGRLHIGRDGAAGELGHVCIEMNGRQCGCGAKGCVEAYASATAVVRRFRELLDDGWESPLGQNIEKVTCRDIFDAALQGDPVAMHIVKRTGEYLGVMASSMAELLNPEVCVISGGMIQAGDALFDPIREICLRRNQHPGRTMSIVPACLGGNAGLVGAADHARVRLEELKHLAV